LIGRISEIIINVIGNNPIDAMKITNDKAAIGTQLRIEKSKLVSNVPFSIIDAKRP
jgi:hypothetical protein